MSPDHEQETARFRVVVNDEAQYSIWSSTVEVPAGWKDAGKEGTKAECLSFIEQVWTDMRPLSLRREMEARKRGRSG